MMRYTSIFILCVSLLVYAFGNNVSVAQEVDKSKRWALIIGIGQYESKDDINPLRFAVNDATAIKESLIHPLTGTFLADHVLLLTDSAPQKPTRANILVSLAVLKNQTRPEDTLLLFFSGHGYPKGQEVYLLPQDARLTILQDTAIPLTVWNERIMEIPALTKVIVLDACHSGGVEKGKGGTGEMSSQFEQFMTPSVGQATLSSSKRGQTSYEDEESGHGVFTRYLLESLRGEGNANGDSVITLKEANDYVEERVRAWGVQKGKVQTPYLESSLTEDVILAIVKSLAIAKPEELAPQTFRIRIDTTPQGAKIILNGQDTQKKTPQILPVPQAGTYQVELTRDGYKPYRVSVTLSTNQPVGLINTPLQKIDISLPEPTKATGILYVIALIENREVPADVYIDGRKVGSTTPSYTNAEMPSKTYQLEVRYSELYHPYKETIAVIENDTTRVKAILAPAFGSLNVTSEPSLASVDVLDMSDTRQKSGQTPLNISPLKSGTYKLKIEKDRYYYPETRTVTIEDGKTTEESVTFRPRFGTLVITSEPPEAEVIVDGTSKGKTPLTFDKVISGNYTIEFHKDQYYYPETRSVKIEDGKTTTESVTFRPRFGTLVIQSEPPGAEIILDGTPKGKTPLTLNRVISGNYTLELRKELHLDWTSTVQIRDGQTTTMPITLPPNYGTLEVNYKPEGASVYLNEERIGTTPLPPIKRKPGTYSLRVTAGDKYRDASQSVVIANGQTLPLEGALQRLKGGVTVLSTPGEADIYLNDKNVGLTPKSLKELDADDYTLKLTKEGYRDYKQTLRISRGMLPDINVTLEKITVPEGMVLIPAGEFEMGSNDGSGNERPVHTVYLDAFYMDKYEVTNAQYAKFLNDHGKNTDAAGHKLLDINNEYCLIEKVGNTYKPKSGYENHPVMVVTWYGAAAYAQFYGKRLPTEAEWEKAARGGLVGKRYPWGDDITHGDANYDGTGDRDKWDGTSPVGSFPANGYGLYDMAGNAWEWCSDWYASDYYAQSPKLNPQGPASGQDRVCRGGSWLGNPYVMRAAFRDWLFPPFVQFLGQGFRCVVSSPLPVRGTQTGRFLEENKLLIDYFYDLAEAELTLQRIGLELSDIQTRTTWGIKIDNLKEFRDFLMKGFQEQYGLKPEEAKAKVDFLTDGLTELKDE